MDDEPELEQVMDAGRVAVIAHVLIKDRDTGQVLVNQRDLATLNRDTKTNNGKPA